MMDKSSDAVGLMSNQVLGKIRWRIVSFAFLLYLCNAMDRVNISFAALQMNKDLNITSIEFGTIASIFFISYFLFQVPSNIFVQRIGARRWIGSIIVGWGLATTLMFFAQNTFQVIVCRLLLGIFEAGFFPGMIYYFTLWIPARERAKVTALFMMAIPVSYIIAAPISGWIVQHGSFFAMAGWRWLFAIEGIPTVLLGLLTFIVLSDRPKDAKWLSQEEKDWIARELDMEQAEQRQVESVGLANVLSNGMLWRLVFIYTFVQAATQAANFWLPGIVKGFSNTFTDTLVGFLMALPYLCAAIIMPLWGSHSDKKGERKYHASLPMLLEGLGFLLIMIADNVMIKIVGLVIFGVCSTCFYGPFWACVPALLNPRILAVAIAMINAGSSLGAFGSNYIIGYIAQSSMKTQGVLLFEAVLCLASFLLMVTMRKKTLSTNHNVNL